MSRALAAVRSAVFVVFLIVTVVPWAIAGLVYSIFVRGERLYWVFVGWLRLAIWAARVICGVRARVQGFENLPGHARSSCCPSTSRPGRRSRSRP